MTAASHFFQICHLERKDMSSQEGWCVYLVQQTRTSLESYMPIYGAISNRLANRVTLDKDTLVMEPVKKSSAWVPSGKHSSLDAVYVSGPP